MDKLRHISYAFEGGRNSSTSSEAGMECFHGGHFGERNNRLFCLVLLLGTFKFKNYSPNIDIVQFITMQEKQDLARAIENQKQNWGLPRIFQ